MQINEILSYNMEHADVKIYKKFPKVTEINFVNFLHEDLLNKAINKIEEWIFKLLKDIFKCFWNFFTCYPLMYQLQIILISLLIFLNIRQILIATSKS